MARVAVVGVGAIGGVLSGLLRAAGGHELSLCTRRPLGRLTVETPEGVVHVEAQNFTDPAQTAVVDWVLIATKTYDNAGAKQWLERLCDEKTQIAVVQNGVEHRQNFAPRAVVPVIIDVPTERRPDGSILQRSKAMMKVEDSAAGREFAALFAGTSAQVEPTADMVSAAWGKLCINAAGVVSALTLKPAGILRDGAWGQVALDLIAECAAVGRAEGAVLDEGIGERILAGYRAGSPDSINSLLADRMAGRQTEIEARNGVIVRLGERHGIATPANRMAVAMFKELTSPKV